MAWLESNAQETIEFEAEPAVVAEVVQDVLNTIGSVKSVSRETGVIEGKVRKGFIFASPVIRVRIARKGTATELSIQAHRQEGTATSGGAQKALTTFLNYLGGDERLAGKAPGGW